MFQLHDSTRRWLATTIFALVCVVPTLFTFGYGLSRNLPGHAAREAERLSAATGLELRLKDVEHLRPGVVRYAGLELIDPTTGVSLFRAPLVEAAWSGPSADAGLTLRLASGEIESPGLAEAWKSLDRWLTRGGPPGRLRLLAARLSVRGTEAAHELTGVQMETVRAPDEARADMAFGVAGMELREPARLQVVVKRVEGVPKTEATFWCGSPLPCELLAAARREFAAFGPQSTFRGYIWADRVADVWELRLSAEFAAIDLERLVTGRFPHLLTGQAVCKLEPARLRDGRLEQASGAFEAVGPATISRSLLDACRHRLAMPAGNQPDSVEPVPYERLSLRFAIDKGEISIRGDPGTATPGAVLANHYGTLLAEPVAPQPLAAVLQALAPAIDPCVPATRQTQWLLDHLELPEAIPPAGAESPLPYVRMALERK